MFSIPLHRPLSIAPGVTLTRPRQALARDLREAGIPQVILGQKGERLEL